MSVKRLRNSQGHFVEKPLISDAVSVHQTRPKWFLPYSLKGKWKVRVYPKWNRIYAEVERKGRLNRKRVRFIRASFEAAVKIAEKTEREIYQHGQLAISLTSEQRYVAAQIFIIAERLGLDALTAFRELESKHPKGGATRTIDQVRLELVAKKRKSERREVYVDGLDYRLRCLVDGLGDIPISAVTTVMLEKEIARHTDWVSGTIHGVVTSWKVLFNYAVKHGYAIANPCVNLELPRRRRAKPELLSALQVHRLLAGCITHDHMARCLAYVAIGCFTGIRPAELQRLRWEMIDLDAGLITIDGEDAKCGERGIVKMQPNLIGWLRPIARKTGAVLNQPVADLRILCRTFLGLKRWPTDCMRHGFASFHYGYFRDIGEVCANLRHGTGQLVFINHYYIVRPPTEAVYYWTRIVRPVALLMP
jgi:integrase